MTQVDHEALQEYHRKEQERLDYKYICEILIRNHQSVFLDIDAPYELKRRVMNNLGHSSSILPH